MLIVPVAGGHLHLHALFQRELVRFTIRPRSILNRAILHGPEDTGVVVPLEFALQRTQMCLIVQTIRCALASRLCLNRDIVH